MDSAKISISYLSPIADIASPKFYRSMLPLTALHVALHYDILSTLPQGRETTVLHAVKQLVTLHLVDHS